MRAIVTGATGHVGTRPTEEIACDGCGRRFQTMDGPGMIAAIKGPCPDCGGAFKLVEFESSDNGSLAERA